ncbi:MAG TPA: DNA repair protein RecO [Anaeromyxobacteraceae bacterium]|nr:DNA repair protein RecO [Anaeromyxobacteraceae bacterium]
MTERLKLRAVVLRTVDSGESDRVVTLLALGRGKLAAYARGARASKKRFAGALEPFTLVDAELSGRQGADLLRLESAMVERSFHAIRGDLARIACAAYAVELARELTRDHEPHDELLELLVDYLGRLDAAPAAPAMLRAWELGALAAAGFQPRLDACARCGAPAPEDGAAFSPPDGGVLCAACAAQGQGGLVLLSAAGLAALRRLQAGGLGAGEAPLEPAAGRESKEALGRFLTHLLGHRLQARKFLDEVGHLLAE